MEQAIIDKLIDWQCTDMEAKVPKIREHNQAKFHKRLKKVFGSMALDGLEGNWLISLASWKITLLAIDQGWDK